MKKSAKQQYLDGGGILCPYCKSEDLKCEAITADDGGIYRKVTCLSCNKIWLDIYTLTDVLTEN